MTTLERLKIVHITPFYDPVVGGMEELVKNIAEGLAKKGHEVHVLTTNRGHDGKKLGRLSVENLSGVWVHRFRCYFKYGFISSFPGFALHLLKNRYDIIHVHAYRHPHTDIASWIGRLKKIPVILHGHGPFHEGSLSRAKKIIYGLYDACARYGIFKSVNLIFAFTELEKAEYARRGADPRRIVVIPNSISDACFDSGNPEAFLDQQSLKRKKIVLCVGRLHPNKNHDVLLIAFAEICRFRPNCVLILAGPDAGEYKKLYVLAQSLGIGEQFRWVGAIKERGDLTNVYRSATCFVMPSRYEPFGLVLIEAMAAGVPVISANAGGPSEIVKTGENGLLFEPGNAEDLANKLRDILDDQSLAGRIGENGRIRAETFRFNPILDKIETIYYSLIPDEHK